MEPKLCVLCVFWMVNLQVLRVGALVQLQDPLGSYAEHAALLCGWGLILAFLYTPVLASSQQRPGARAKRQLKLCVS